MDPIITRIGLLRRLGEPRLLTLLSKVDPKIQSLKTEPGDTDEQIASTNAGLKAMDDVLTDVTAYIRGFVPVTDKSVCQEALIEYLVTLCICSLARMSATALPKPESDACIEARKDLMKLKEAREKKEADPNTPATDRPKPKYQAGPPKIFTLETMSGI